MNSHRTYFINLINALGTRDSQMASLLNPILKKNESNKQKEDGYGNGFWEKGELLLIFECLGALSSWWITL